MSETEVSADTLTPIEMADRMLNKARVREPHNPLLPKLETLRNELVEQVRENGNLNRRAVQLRHIIDEQAHRIQSGLDRIAQLEAERDGAYRERAHLVALLAAQYPSHIGYTDPTSPDWAVVTVELDTGQACWHIAAEDMHVFAHVEPTPRYARGWDCHTTEEKYARVDKLACQLHAAAERRGYRLLSEPDDTAGSAT